MFGDTAWMNPISSYLSRYRTPFYQFLFSPMQFSIKSDFCLIYFASLFTSICTLIETRETLCFTLVNGYIGLGEFRFDTRHILRQNKCVCLNFRTYTITRLLRCISTNTDAFLKWNKRRTVCNDITLGTIVGLFIDSRKVGLNGHIYF